MDLQTNIEGAPWCRRPPRSTTAILTLVVVVAAQAGDLRCLAGQTQDVHPGVGAVDDVDEAAPVNLDVVGLDDDVARIVDAQLAALGARIGSCRSPRNEEAHLTRAERLADVDRPHAGIEPGGKHQLAVEDAGERLVAGVGTETAAAGAEVT